MAMYQEWRTRLTREEELRLALRARAGDVDARNTLVCAHLAHVSHLARRFARTGIPEEDLCHEAVLGLLRAVEGFNPDTGLRFNSYARWWVLCFLVRYVDTNRRCVRGSDSRAMRLLRARLGRTERELASRLGRSPSAPEVAEALGVTEKDVLDARATMRGSDVSLEVLAEGAHPPASPRPDPEQVVAVRELQQLRRTAVRGALSRLDKRERMIVSRRFLEPAPPTLSDLGDELGISRERVRQLEARGIAKMRSAVGRRS